MWLASMVSVASTRALCRLSLKGKKVIVWPQARRHICQLLVAIQIDLKETSLIAHLSRDLNIELLKTTIKIHLK